LNYFDTWHNYGVRCVRNKKILKNSKDSKKPKIDMWRWL